LVKLLSMRFSTLVTEIFSPIRMKTMDNGTQSCTMPLNPNHAGFLFGI
jgi:hypothetical protein